MLGHYRGIWHKYSVMGIARAGHCIHPPWRQIVETFVASVIHLALETVGVRCGAGSAARTDIMGAPHEAAAAS